MMTSPNLPSWARDIDVSLSLHPQILLTGNVRDYFPIASNQINLIDTLWRVCEARGFACLGAWDGVSASLTLHWNPNITVEERLADSLKAGIQSTKDFADLIERVQQYKDAPVALVVQYVARLAPADLPIQAEERRLLARAEVFGHQARPALGNCYSTIFWVCSRQEELHPSFVIDSPSLRVIRIPYPDPEIRVQAAQSLIASGDPELSDREMEKRAGALAEVSHGMTVRDIRSLYRLVKNRDEEFHDDSYTDAARLLQIGTYDDRWSATVLRSKIKTAEEYLNARVLGQKRAVAKAVDVLVRSAAGLNGAHMSSSPNRPRGVLFLAGPTGVGKTELAKGIASLVLGQDTEPIRFDMSEFRADEARQRLIGAPPGYVGYDAGGELTNAVRANPVCVLLFDEIEKAHPRIFDLFLQILEDGRLTDGRGATVHFTECFLIFTSNLGTVERTVDRQTVPSLSSPDMPNDQVEEQLRIAFETFFDTELGRPEIRNRFGDGFVALDYIRPEVAPQILDKALRNVEDRVKKVHGIYLDVSAIVPLVTKKILANLGNGGRGIGTTVETMVVNPLAHELLFGSELAPASRVKLVGLTQADGRWTLETRICPG